MATTDKNTPFDGRNYPSECTEQPMRVSNCNVYVYLPMKGERSNMVFHIADTYNDLFTFYSDRDLRAITGFPRTRYTIYDEYHRLFVDLPTYSSIMVSASGMIVIKAASVCTHECPELGNLIQTLHRRAKRQKPLPMLLIDYKSDSEVDSEGTSSDTDNHEVGSPTDQSRSAD